jgi:hypothetical protein
MAVRMNQMLRLGCDKRESKITARSATKAALVGALFGCVMSLGMQDVNAAQRGGGEPRFTLGQLADSVWVADSLANFEAAHPKLHARLKAAVHSLRQFSRPIDELTFSDALKATQPTALDEAPADMGKVLRDVEFLKQVSLNELKEALTKVQSVTSDRIISLREPITAYQRIQIQGAYDKSRNRLFRYEQRYGENAPKLNVIEAGVSYLLQGLYPFGPNERGPGPLEPVLRYSTTWVKAYDDNSLDIPREFTVSALWELGLRWYWYSAPEARPSLLGLMKPSYIAVGCALAASNRDWFFIINDEPFDPGFFVDLGFMRAAMTFGENNRVFVGRQFQVVPHLF